MQKTKLGVSVGLLGAMVCLAALFGGYTVVILLAGYVLLFEENEWLKKTAVKAVALLVMFSFALNVIGLLPDVLSWIRSLFAVIGLNFHYAFISNLVSVITQAIDIVRTVLFLLLGYQALNQGTVKIPVVDKLVDKYF